MSLHNTLRNGVTVQWPPKMYGSERCRLLTTSFVVALSFEHMAFHVFVQAGCSDPYLVCSRIQLTALITLTLALLSIQNFIILVHVNLCIDNAFVTPLK